MLVQRSVGVKQAWDTGLGTQIPYGTVSARHQTTVVSHSPLTDSNPTARLRLLSLIHTSLSPSVNSYIRRAGQEPEQAMWKRANQITSA
jgi:hypothetical protein